MRMLKRNQRQLWYSNPTGEVQSITDEWGNETGEVIEIFSEPRSTMLNISAAVGQENVSVFGSSTDYTRVIAASLECPIVERARVWYKCDPNGPHNYVARRVADSLNAKLIALSEVSQ